MISIITVTMRQHFMENILANYTRQDWAGKELIIILNNDDLKLEEWRERAKLFDRVRVYQVPEKYTLGKCLNWAIARVNSKVIAKFDDDDYYGAGYLRESMLALKRKKRANIVGKHTSYIYFEEKEALMLFRDGYENKYRKRVKGGTLLFNRSVWKKMRFNEKEVAGSDSRWLLDCAKAGVRTYSVTRANYVCIRRQNTTTHTQKRSTKRYMARCKLICYTSDYISTIKELTKNKSLNHKKEAVGVGDHPKKPQ